MANVKKKENEKIISFTDADKKQIKNDVINDIKDDLIKQVSDDVYNTFTKTSKERISEELAEEIKEDVKRKIAKEEAKLSRGKSFKIFRLSIYIIVLLAAIVYGVYRLYKTDSFDILKYNYKNTTVATSTTGTTEGTTEVKKKTQEELLGEYGSLLDDIYISDINVLAGNKNVADLTDSERLAIAYNAILKSNVSHDGKVYTVLGAALEETFNKIFGANALYKTADFTADGLNYTYLSSQNSFFAIGDADETKYFESAIIDIVEGEETVTINTVVGYSKDGKLYSINNLVEPVVVSYTSNVGEYADSLTGVSYTFNKVDGSYKLAKIEAK